MKKSFLLSIAMILVIQLVYTQTNLLTEDFETDGEGSRYTSNNFDVGCNDFFERYTNGGGNCLSNEPTNVSGTYYWAGEDVDQASGGTGIVTINALNVTGYTLEMDVMLACGRCNDGRFEPDDELLFQYNIDGGGWVTFAAFYGNNDVSLNGNLTEDADLDGSHDVGGAEISSSDFTDWNFSIPATGNSLEIRFIMGQSTGTEEVMLDNIRINSTMLPVELTQFSLSETENGAVSILWQTASEKNNDYFTIERSMDALSWEVIAQVDGTGDSFEITNYKIMDARPYFGVSYYRLKQTDFNGEFSYSNVETIQVTQTQDKNISIYPTPSVHELNIQADAGELNELVLTDLRGQNIYTFTKADHLSDTHIKINIEHIPSGLYLLKTKSSIKKVLINH